MRLFKYAVATLLLVQTLGICVMIIHNDGVASFNVYGIAFVVSALCIVALLFRSGWRGDTGSSIERLLVLFGFTALSDEPRNGTSPKALPGARMQTGDNRIYAIMLVSVLVWTLAISPLVSGIVLLVSLIPFWYCRSKPSALLQCPICRFVIDRTSDICPQCKSRLPQNVLNSFRSTVAK